MTQEQLKKQWDVIKAFKEGKSIQLLSNGEWYDLKGDVSFDASTVYRIKPEPELIPFDYSDAEYLIGRAVIHKMSQVLWIIIAVELTSVLLSKHEYTYEELLDKFRFLDGTPCGKPSQP